MHPAPRVDKPRHPFRLIVAAASAGGLRALDVVLAGFPIDLPVPVAIVQHVAAGHQSLAPEILGRRTKIRVVEGADGSSLQPGTAYVAPSDYHMLIGAGLRIVLDSGEPLHFLRPAADCLFESAARTVPPVMAIILTGTGSDGAAGVVAVKRHGGFVIAQDEATSEFFNMPFAAITTGVVDLVLPLDRIAAAVIEQVGIGAAT